MRNILTVDVEEWYHGNDFDLPRERWASLGSRVEAQTDLLLDLLDRHDARATFFVLGCVAEAHPGLVGRIRERGHEIGSHSYYHDLVYNLTPEQFETQLRDSARTLTRITAEPVRAFRAPSWSITGKNPWALDVVRACGFEVDSSLFPLRTWMYGVKNARLDIHAIDGGDGPALLEYPPAAARLGGLTVPVAGGIFFRLLPYRITSAVLRRINRAGRPAVVYLHPWELDPDQPRLPDIPSRRTWFHYWGLGAALQKYTRLLGEFRFGSIRQHRDSVAAEKAR
jgi:polysaccharide deacetylase family protein (PEP-CTERM system associated)